MVKGRMGNGVQIKGMFMGKGRGANEQDSERESGGRGPRDGKGLSVLLEQITSSSPTTLTRSFFSLYRCEKWIVW